MKTLIMGDIHGNLIALEKCLKVYGKLVDQIVCHGDVVNYGPWSDECVDLLEHVGAITLKGNHEEAYLQGSYPGENELVKMFFNHTYPRFNRHEKINSYKNSYEMDLFTVTHTINDSYYYPDSDLSNLNLSKSHIIGHSHYSFIRELEDDLILANTGSIGQNRKNLSFMEFILLDTEINKLELKKIEYNTTPLINEMVYKNYPQQCIDYYKSKL